MSISNFMVPLGSNNWDRKFVQIILNSHWCKKWCGILKFVKLIQICQIICQDDVINNIFCKIEMWQVSNREKSTSTCLTYATHL